MMKFYLFILALMFVVNYTSAKELILDGRISKKGKYIEKEMPFSYFPEYSVGKLQMSVDAWRNLNVEWNGIPLLTESGQIFSRQYKRKQGNLQTGLHPYNEDNSARDIPVRVIRKNGKVEYIWSCWDYKNGVRQTNRAKLEKNRVTLDVSLEFSKNIPAAVYFHPVLFPGVKDNYKSGIAEDEIEGKDFTVIDSLGKRTISKYSKNNKKLWVKENCRDISVDLPNGNVKYSFSSNIKEFAMNFYTGETWAHDLWSAQRNAIVGDAMFKLQRKHSKLTWRTVIEVKDGNSSKLAPLKVDFPERVQCNVNFGREFGYFYPDENISLKLELDNRWSAKDKKAAIFYEVRNYQNKIIKQKCLNKLLPAKTIVELDLNLGSLPRSAYSVSVLIQNKKQKDLGFICFRIGVVPRLKPYSSEKSFFGAFQAYKHNIKTKIALAKYTGIRKVRFRSGNNEEVWSKFEPEQGEFNSNIIGPSIAKQYAESNIAMWFHGQQYPPQLFMRNNKFKLPAGLKKDDLVFAYYHSRIEKKDGYLPKNGSLFMNYVKKLVSNYPMIHTYEVMNEPSTKMDIDFAARTIKLVSQAVKSLYPKAKIQGMAINKLSPEIIEWTEKVLDKAHPYIDTVSFHQYLRGWYKLNSQSYFLPIEALGWEKQLAEIGRVAKKYGKEYCNSEMSWMGCQNELLPDRNFSPQEKNSVNMFLRSYLLTKAGGASSITLCFGISLRSTFCDYILSVEKGACLVGLRKMVKPWSVAHASLVDLMEGAIFIKRVDMETREIYNMLFKGINNKLWSAVWNYKNPGFIEHSFNEEEVVIKDPTGGIFPFSKSLGISGSPIFFINKTLSPKVFKEKLSSMKYILGKGAEIESISLKDGNNEQLRVRLKNLSLKPVKIMSLGYKSGYKKTFKGLCNFTLSPGIHSFDIPVALASTTKMCVKMELKGEAGEFYDSRREWFSNPYPATAKRFGALQVYQAKKAPVVDGDPSDKTWKYASLICLNKKEYVTFDPKVKKNSWDGADDLSVKARLLWDNNYLYFLAEVKDNIHLNNQQSPNIAAWAGDAIQIALDLNNDSKKTYGEDDHEINIALWQGKPIAWHRTFGKEISSGPFLNAKLAIVRNEKSKTTVYEFAIPLKSLAPWKSGSIRSKCIKFNFIVNDDDGKGSRRTKWIGITKGIGDTKNPELYKDMLFLSPNWKYYISEKEGTILETGGTIRNIETKAQDWKMDLGKEFPGAKGKMEMDSSTAKTGISSLKLTADFRDGGKYIGIKQYLKLSVEEKIKSIEFWIKSPNQNKINFRIIDSKKQTHHLSLSIKKSDDWQRIVIKEFNKNSKGCRYANWGGPKDGKFYHPAKMIEIIIPKLKKNENVTIWIDDMKINLITELISKVFN